MTAKRPYAGQSWGPEANGANLTPGLALQLMGKDLADNARAIGLSRGPVELWANEQAGLKGFFAGDTSSLPAQGWTKLATL